MKKIAEKVVLVAQICITLVFVLTTVLYMTGVLAYTNTEGSNGVTFILIIVLAIVYVALSAYMLYVNFSERESLKKILLFADCHSSTRTNIKVLYNVVRGCEEKVDGISVKKLRVRTDEKGGLIAIFNVKVSADNIAKSIDDLRCLLVESFRETFGLTFNAVNFEIDRLKGKYQPNQTNDTTDEEHPNVEQIEQREQSEVANDDGAETEIPQTEEEKEKV